MKNFQNILDLMANIFTYSRYFSIPKQKENRGLSPNRLPY
jgi:hypothetical protein